MSDTLKAAVGITIPFFGTAIGSMSALFIKTKIKPWMHKAMLGFASGVMIAASVWSLLIPSIEMAEKNGGIGWVPSAVGFLLGVGFLLLADRLLPLFDLSDNLHRGTKLGNSFMLAFAVTLHNIPEGMAVGVAFAGLKSNVDPVTAAGAFALTIGIAVQNFPEGAIISTPLVTDGMSRKKAFLIGVLSGAVEPIGALLTIMLTSLITAILPYILAFAAGAMVYVVTEELIPESIGTRNNVGTVGTALGFVLMMILDVACG